MTRKTIKTYLVFLLTMTMIFTTSVGIYAESDMQPLVEEETPSNPAISLELEKKGTSYKLGESIEYDIRVKNTGDVVLSELALEDNLSGKETIATLEVGEELLYERAYNIPDDSEKEFIENEITLSVQLEETKLEKKTSFKAYMEQMSSIEFIPDEMDEAELGTEEPEVDESEAEEAEVEEPYSVEPYAEKSALEEPDEEKPKEESKLEDEIGLEDTALPTTPDIMQKSMMAITPLASGTTINAQNYFDATGTSTNGHYKAEGIYIDNNGDIHILLNEVGGGDQYRFLYGTLNSDPFLNTLDGKKDVLQKTNPISLGISATISLPDGTDINVGGAGVWRVWDFNIGPMIDKLEATNELYIKNQADGYTIDITDLKINLAHSITKEVDKSLATIGDELIYTVTVSNTGDFQLSGINVYDDVPAGLTIVKVSEDGVTWNDPTYQVNNVILYTNLTLAVGESKSYYIKATVNEDATDGQTITNTAFTGGSVPKEEDTAEVEIEVPIDVTIRKVITGNFGDLSREFDFTVAVGGGTPIGFQLSHNETEVISGLPADAVLTLTEDSGDYDVTVKVGETTINPNQDGSYTITLIGEDITITVTNNYDVTIDTGIPLDSIPYIIIMAMVALGLGIMIRKRYAGNQY